MFKTLFRSFWRVNIFIIGVFGTAVIVFKIFPYADTKLPVYIALLATYSLFAYIFIPTIIRLFRLVIKPNHIPLYVTTGDGWPSDPVNIAIIAKNRRTLIQTMERAGWYTADAMTFKNGLRELISVLFNKPYPEAPLSNLYLFGKKHAIGFEIPTNRAKSARTRHHVRFWKLDEPKIANSQHPHVSFWQKKLQHLFGRKNEIWIGAATEEVFPIDVQWYTGRLTHGGSHDDIRERDFIIQSLRQNKSIKKIHTSDPGEEVSFRGQQFRTIYVTDGAIKIIELKNSDWLKSSKK